MSGTTFVDACLAGAALLKDIDDWVDRWHDANGAPTGRAVPLSAYLGLNKAQRPPRGASRGWPRAKS